MVATLCMIVVVAGLVVAGLWWRGDGRPMTPRCPRCWYPQALVLPATCSECGRTASDVRELHRRRRPQAVLAAAAALCLLGAGGWAYTAATWGCDVLEEAKSEYPARSAQDLFNVQLPYALALSSEVVEDPFDAVLVDEGQDFREEFWLGVELLLRDESFGREMVAQ